MKTLQVCLTCYRWLSTIKNLIADSHLLKWGSISKNGNCFWWSNGWEEPKREGSTVMIRSKRVRKAPTIYLGTLSWYAQVDETEPEIVKEALTEEDSYLWKEALNDEYESLVKSNMWILTERPKDKYVIDCNGCLKIAKFKMVKFV